MGIDEHLRINGPSAPGDNKPAVPPASDKTEFRRLLEKLENVARDSSTPEVKDIDNLNDAVKRADDDFRAVMDLRKQIEDAYRRTHR